MAETIKELIDGYKDLVNSLTLTGKNLSNQNDRLIQKCRELINQNTELVGILQSIVGDVGFTNLSEINYKRAKAAINNVINSLNE